MCAVALYLENTSTPSGVYSLPHSLPQWSLSPFNLTVSSHFANPLLFSFLFLFFFFPFLFYVRITIIMDRSINLTRFHLRISSVKFILLINKYLHMIRTCCCAPSGRNPNASLTQACPFHLSCPTSP